jgi:hypothetical protein
VIGKKFAHYEIVGALGKGGMGEVYRAHDTKLGRDVALKLLPDEVARDPERVARFRREAKVLASLNHPSIAALYGLEEENDRYFLIMELAEGEDMSQRMQRGAIPIQQALPIALQIAEALEAAHAKSIVHRDLKPANVMLSSSSQVKLLDFGLARAYHPEETDGDPMTSPTITAAMTQQGVVLGTAAYMSPEQARGKSIDKQSDIWAFGVLFFEMLTGHRLFDGETISDSIGAILHKDPDWNLLPTDTPPHIRQLLHRCLERDRDRRLRDIGDARVAIVDAQRDPTGSSLGIPITTDTSTGGRRGFVGIAIASVVALAIGLGVGTQLRPKAPERSYRALDLGIDLSPSGAQDDGIQAVIAPDGHGVVFTHEDQIWLHEFDEMEARPLEGSKAAFAPFWSPDATEIGWFQGGRLWKIKASGGRPTALCEYSARVAGGVGASWGDDGRIVFSTGSTPAFSVSALGGQAREEIPLRENVGDLHEPHVLLDGQGILVVEHPSDRGPSQLSLWRDGEYHKLFDSGVGNRVLGPVYDPRGYILMRREGNDLIEGLWAIAFDLGSGTVSGEAFLVESDASGASVASDGSIVFVRNPRRSNEKMISRFAANGASREVLVPAHVGEMYGSLSPDGKKIAFTAEPVDGGQNQIWVRDLARGTESQLTAGNNPCFEPRWSPDSETLFYSSFDLATSTVGWYRIPADGSRETQRAGEGFLSALHPDGEFAFVVLSAGLDDLQFARMDTTDAWLVRVDDVADRKYLLGGDERTFPAALSPDQEFLLSGSEKETGRASLYLTRWPELTGRWKVSHQAGFRIAGFRSDGSSIFYTLDETLYEVPFESGASPSLGRAEPTFELPQGSLGIAMPDPSGEGILVSHPDDSLAGSARETRRGVKVVEGWTEKIAGR